MEPLWAGGYFFRWMVYSPHPRLPCLGGATLAGVGTWLTVKVGRPLVQLNFAGQGFEGDFRFSVARLRESAESVASYGGEPVEFEIFEERFQKVFANFRSIMARQMRVNCLTQGYAQVAVIFPLLVVLPRYFLKQIGWGWLDASDQRFLLRL